MNNLEFKEVFDNILNQYLDSINIVEPLSSALKYSILNGGKRIRPYLVYLGAKSVSDPKYTDVINNIKELALGIELIHSYSLVHDDLPCMDNDTLRRGKPTTHVLYGAGMATLAGDGMLNLASEVMLNAIDNPESMKCDIVKNNILAQIKASKYILNNSGIYGMVSGQCMDLKEDKSSYSINDYKKMNLMKTSALIKAALVSGAIRFEADDEIIFAFEKYSENFGLIFQIVDDILDVTSTEEVLGKNINSDKDNNKLTYIDFVGLDDAKKECIVLANEAKDCIYSLANKIYNADVLVDLIDSMLVRKF